MQARSHACSCDLFMVTARADVIGNCLFLIHITRHTDLCLHTGRKTVMIQESV
jgi:hypothetical protein